MPAKAQPTRAVPSPVFFPLPDSPAQWRSEVRQQLTRAAQQQRAVLIHDDPVFSHHLCASLEHAGTQVCSLTPTTSPYEAHAAAVLLSDDLHAVWKLILNEDALTGTVRPTTLFVLPSPEQLALPSLPSHFQFILASSRTVHVEAIIFDPASQLSGTQSKHQHLARTAAL